MTNLDLASISRQAVQCRVCFDDLNIEPATIDIAQPRWVGPKYFSTKPRVLFVLLNPGSGESRKGSADHEALELLRNFRDNKGSLESVLRHQAKDMPNWGRGRFAKFYLDGLGLELDEIAFANVAWCSARGNKYPSGMLRTCFEKHTRQLIGYLDPDVVLLSGGATHRFDGEVSAVVPGAAVLPILHYAHRLGKVAEDRELKRVRKLIERAKD